MQMLGSALLLNFHHSQHTIQKVSYVKILLLILAIQSSYPPFQTMKLGFDQLLDFYPQQ